MSWSRESKQTAAALGLLAIGIALLAAPSLLALRPAPPTALELALKAQEDAFKNNPSPNGRPQLTADLEAGFANGPARRPNSSPQLPAPPRAAAVTPPTAECRAIAAQIKTLLDEDDGSGGMGEAQEKIDAADAAGQACPELYIEQARLAMRTSGMYPQTLEMCEAALRKGLQQDPQHGNTFVLLGYVLTHQSRLDEAAAAFDDARRFKADSPWLALNVGELLLGQGKVEEGLRHYQKAVDDPAMPARIRGQAVEAMARQYARDGRQAEARDAYEKLIAGGQDGAWTLGNYSHLLRTRMLDTRRSLEMGRRALAKMDYPLGRENLGATLYLAWAEALITEKNKAKAEKLYAEARQYAPDPGELLLEVIDYPHPHPIIEALKAKGVSLDQFPGRAPGGETPLSLAARRGKLALAEQLLAAGANPNRSGYGGTTPLMLAAGRGDTELVRTLLQRGADPALREEKGQDAGTIAREAGHAATAQLLAAAKGQHKPGSASGTGVDAGGLPLVAYRYRALRDIEGVDLYSGVAKGDTVVFERSGGRITDEGLHDPNAIWLNFRTAKGRELQLAQWLDRLDWQKTFEFVPES